MQCGELVGEHGEDEIYDAFAGSKSLFSFMCSDGKSSQASMQTRM